MNAAADGTPCIRELICLALVEGRAETYIEGFIVADTMIRPASGDNRFTGYQSPGGEPLLASFEKSCAHLRNTRPSVFLGFRFGVP